MVEDYAKHLALRHHHLLATGRGTPPRKSSHQHMPKNKVLGPQIASGVTIPTQITARRFRTSECWLQWIATQGELVARTCVYRTPSGPNAKAKEIVPYARPRKNKSEHGASTIPTTNSDSSRWDTWTRVRWTTNTLRFAPFGAPYWMQWHQGHCQHGIPRTVLATGTGCGSRTKS